MSARLRLTVQQAIDAEEALNNFVATVGTRSDTCAVMRRSVTEISARILALLREAPDLILAERR